MEISWMYWKKKKTFFFVVLSDMSLSLLPKQLIATY